MGLWLSGRPRAGRHQGHKCADKRCRNS
jgi:hypothetical protein